MNNVKESNSCKVGESGKELQILSNVQDYGSFCCSQLICNYQQRASLLKQWVVGHAISPV